MSELIICKCPVCKESATAILDLENAKSACPNCGAVIKFKIMFNPEISYYDKSLKGKDSLDLWEYTDKIKSKRNQNIFNESLSIKDLK